MFKDPTPKNPVFKNLMFKNNNKITIGFVFGFISIGLIFGLCLLFIGGEKNSIFYKKTRELKKN